MTSSMLSHKNYEKKSFSKSEQFANHLTERAEIANRLSRRYEQLLRNEKYCDCHFLVANTKFRCHKIILTAASPVFEAMFYGPIKESAMEIEIDDISPEIFELLLAFIYSGALDFEQLTLEALIELYYGAEKYLLDDLIQDSLMAITHKLRFENILPALELSVCMNLAGLLNICMSFFTRCCLMDSQYMNFLKTSNQHHVSKDCIKAIIAANKEIRNQLLWFVLEWCEQECHELGLQKSDCAVIINDLDLENSEYVFANDGSLLMEGNHLYQQEQQLPMPQCQILERTYYKACRPFNIDYELHTWKFVLKCKRFISLHGLVLHSRLIPTAAAALSHNLPSEYNESLTIEICKKASENLAENLEDSSLVWRHVISKQPTKYNCDLNLRWSSGVVLSPDVEYEIKLNWSSDAYGAEYPCSLMSNIVDGIEFNDYSTHFGSLVKGLYLVNLV